MLNLELARVSRLVLLVMVILTADHSLRLFCESRLDIWGHHLDVHRLFAYVRFTCRRPELYLSYTYLVDL